MPRKRRTSIPPFIPYPDDAFRRDIEQRAIEEQQAIRARKLSAIFPLLAYVDMGVSPLVLEAALAEIRTAFFPDHPSPAAHRPKGSGTYRDTADFLSVLIPIVQDLQTNNAYPSQTRVAESWTGRHSEKQIQRWFRQYVTYPLGWSWKEFLDYVKDVPK